MRYPRLLPLFGLVIGLTFAAQPAVAGLQGQLDEMFGSLINVTTPTAHMGQRRGVVGGGNLYARARIMTPNIISFAAPSVSAGCGGIDFFGGSFSYINADQFVQLMRSIAANAAGHLFMMALDQMSPTLGSSLRNLQDKIQKMNQALGNSCQLAQGLVADTADAIQGKELNQSGLIAQTTGAVEGVFDAVKSISVSGESPQKKAKETPEGEAEVKRTIEGNVIWRALKSHNVDAWFSSGDDTLLSTIMSITGTVIVSELASGDEAQAPMTLPPTGIGLRDLVFGGDAVPIYDCSGQDQDGCLSPNDSTEVIEGLKPKFDQIILGTGGLIDKFAVGTDEPSDEEKAFMEISPVGAMLNRLTLQDKGVARLFALRYIDVISIDASVLMLYDMLDAASASLAGQSDARVKEAQQMIADARQRISEEYRSLMAKHASARGTIEAYVSITQTLKAHRYGTFGRGAGGE
jgi:conjugative transfer pilus assembly protein TraH